MDIEISLLPHQKALIQSEKSIKGLCCGRGAGKSYIMSIMIAIDLMRGKKCIAMAQGFKALSINLFAETCARLDMFKQKYDYNKGQMYIKCGKGIVYGATYENEDSVRGLTEVESLYLDELCLAKNDLLSVVAPCLRGNFVPQIVFATSPRIGSFWNNWIKESMLNGSADVFNATMLDNSFISSESIELSQSAITDPLLIRQEIYGEILDATDGSQLVTTKDLLQTNVKDSFGYTFGLDMSGTGKDKCSLCCRKGHILVDIVKSLHWTGDEALRELDRMILKHSIPIEFISCVNIDLAYGSAAYERISQKYNANLVPFASKADDQKFANKRAEMYWRCKTYIEEGMSGLDDEDLKQELLNTRWSLDKNDKIIIVPKDEIKAIIHRSPDTADALALTFAEEDETIYNLESDEFSDYKVRINLGDPED